MKEYDEHTIDQPKWPPAATGHHILTIQYANDNCQ